MRRVAAPAKLNLVLRVVGSRDDGFHDIETLLLRLDLHDDVAIEPDHDGLEFSATGSFSVPAGRENSCWSAAEAFFEASGLPPRAAIRLVKRVPVSAGLGGGSSDAASVLVGLNESANRPLDPTRLMEIAAGLGSDVPFFVSGAAACVARGRGEQLELVPAPPSRPVLIVVPDFGISAYEAYEWWDTDGGHVTEPAPLPGPGQPAGWDVLSEIARNDLAEPVFRRHAAVREGVAALVSAGAGPALLCGSGSCIAGVFGSAAEVRAAVGKLASSPSIPGSWLLIETRTVASGAQTRPG